MTDVTVGMISPWSYCVRLIFCTMNAWNVSIRSGMQFGSVSRLIAPFVRRRVRIASRLDTNRTLTYGLAQGKWKSQAPACSQRFPLWRFPMPLSLTTLSLVASPVTLQEGLKILERDDYRCQYCGLDGRASFENALVMSVDFVVPRARKGKKDPRNLVACCRPCNAIKGTRVYANLEEAKAFVLKNREALRKTWGSKTARLAATA